MATEKEMKGFQDGVFKPYFQKYISYQRSKGKKVAQSTISLLKSLNNALSKYETLNITQGMTEEILAPDAGISEISRYGRINCLRQFSAFLLMLGVECYQVPRRYAKSIQCQFRPYIFRDDEIIRLVDTADNRCRRKFREHKTDVYPILLRLLIGTGVRISEALALRRSDIFCDNGVINVVNSKNGVSRYVPMSDSLTIVMQKYLSVSNVCEFLFTSPQTGYSYHYNTIKGMFKKICASAEIIRHDGTLPNIHSLRHTFCSKSLEQMLRAGMNLYVAIPILAAYVGHVNFRDTERYIHFTESGYSDLLAKQESLRKIIPEVSLVE